MTENQKLKILKKMTKKQKYEYDKASEKDKQKLLGELASIFFGQ